MWHVVTAMPHAILDYDDDLTYCVYTAKTCLAL